MTKPLEKQTVAQLRKAATKKKARVCGAPSKMKKAELIRFLGAQVLVGGFASSSW